MSIGTKLSVSFLSCEKGKALLTKEWVSAFWICRGGGRERVLTKQEGGRRAGAAPQKSHSRMGFFAVAIATAGNDPLSWVITVEPPRSPLPIFYCKKITARQHNWQLFPRT